MHKKFSARSLWPVVFGIPFTILPNACGKGSKTSSSTGVSVNNDAASLATRMIGKDEEVKIVLVDTSSLGFYLRPDPVQVTLKLIAELSAPVVDGDKVQATSVALLGDRAVVGFNMRGEKAKGGIDVVTGIPANLAEFASKKPTLTSEILFKDTDVNAIRFEDPSIYYAGNSVRSGQPAFAARTDLVSGKLVNEGSRAGVSSFAAVGIEIVGTQYYVASGDAGDVTLLDKVTLAPSSTLPLKDLRSLTKNKAKTSVLALTGQPGTLRYLDNANKVLRTVNLGGLSVPGARAQVVAGKDTSLVSLGDGGVKLICNDDGVILSSMPQLTSPGIPAPNTVTNSVSVSGNYVFTANGEAGIALYQFVKSGNKKAGSSCQEASLVQVGSLNFGAALSANEIAIKGNTLFVADGLGGIKIVLISNPSNGNADGDYAD